jgi:hypothetical protein
VSPDRMASVKTTVDGRELTISNLDKVLYPATGFTKGDMIDYYTKVAGVMLPHVRDRPLTMKRFPDGVDGPSFFEKHTPAHGPSCDMSPFRPPGMTPRSTTAWSEICPPCYGQPTLPPSSSTFHCGM